MANLPRSGARGARDPSLCSGQAPGRGTGIVPVLAPKPRWFQCFSVSVFQCFSACPGNRGLNDKYHSPRIYSWVEFGARDTPNLIPRNSNLILYAISIRFVIITVSATVQISDFEWPIFRAAEASPGARGRDDQWLFTGICAWADTAFRPRPTMIFIIDKIYPHSHPLQISDFRFQISDFEWPIFRAAEASPGARGRDDQWLFTGICAWADTAFRPRPTMIFIIDKIYPHSHPLQISDFRFQISDFEWPIFRAAEAPPGYSARCLRVFY